MEEVAATRLPRAAGDVVGKHKVVMKQVLDRHRFEWSLEIKMKQSEIHASVFASQALVLATKRVSASLDTFSGWLAAGFGAALALFIANLDTVSKFVLLGNIKWASVLFLVSALFAIGDKFLAAFIAAGTTAATEGAALGKDLAERGVELNVPAFFSEIERALLWPLSAFAHRAFAKAGTGDFGGPGRMYTKAAQIQAIVVILQAGLGFYPVSADTSDKPHHGAGGVSWQNERSTAKSSSVRRSS